MYLENSIVFILPVYIQVILKVEFSICSDIKWIQDTPVLGQQPLPRDEPCQCGLALTKVLAVC